MLFFHHLFFYNVIKYSIGVSSFSLSIFTRFNKQENVHMISTMCNTFNL